MGIDIVRCLCKCKCTKIFLCKIIWSQWRQCGHEDRRGTNIGTWKRRDPGSDPEEPEGGGEADQGGGR